MADVIGLFCSSSYLLTSLNSSLHPVILPDQSLIRKVSRVSNSGSVSAIGGVVHAVLGRPRKELGLFKVQAAVAEATDQPKWWEKNAPNMIDIHSTEEFLSALSEALDRLVIVEFYGTWCASCRALFPKLCRTAEEHPEILFLKVNFDENKQMCKSMNVKVLPYFHFYRGADGQVDAFSCSLAKFQKIKDAIELHNLKQSSNDPQKVNNSNSQPL